MFIVLFLLAGIALAYLWFTNQGIFWDYLPMVSVVIAVLSLAFAIFNFVRRNAVGFLFMLFFAVFVAGIILSGLFGPFALNLRAQNYVEDQLYGQAIDEYLIIVENYPDSRYYENAIKNLPFAYYHNNDCAQALHYLNQAENMGLISPTLEVKEIYAECHFWLAEQYMAESNYRQAANHYMDTLTLYRTIQQEFPGSDQAFLAEHKIPELTFLAASAYRRIPDWEQAIQLFNEILERYPATEYAQKSSELLFVGHINKAIALKNDAEYGQAIQAFLQVIDIFSEPQDIYRVTHYQNIILSDIPQYHLNNAAYDFFREGDYQKAAYLYQAILDYYPQANDDCLSYLCQAKVNYIRTINYRNLVTEGDPVRIYMPEASVLDIINESIYFATLYLTGPQEQMVSLAPDSRERIELPAGNYQAALEYEGEGSTPFFGTLNLEENLRYTITIE